MMETHAEAAAINRHLCELERLQLLSARLASGGPEHHNRRPAPQVGGAEKLGVTEARQGDIRCS